MIVKCVKNKLSDFEKGPIKEILTKKFRRNEDEKIGELEIGKLYTVYGMNLNSLYESIPYFYICEEDYDENPIPRSAVFFEVVDPRPSKYWNFSYDVVDQTSGLFFPEWIQDELFCERLIDGAEPETHIFLKYKELIDNETFALQNEPPRSFLDWFDSWYKKYCDGPWDYKKILDVETTSNPGWAIKIETIGPPLEEFEFDSGLIEKTDTHWYIYSFKKGIFNAAGDQTKLKYLFEQFRRIAENHEPKKASISEL